MPGFFLGFSACGFLVSVVRSLSEVFIVPSASVIGGVAEDNVVHLRGYASAFGVGFDGHPNDSRAKGPTLSPSTVHVIGTTLGFAAAFAVGGRVRRAQQMLRVSSTRGDLLMIPTFATPSSTVLCGAGSSHFRNDAGATMRAKMSVEDLSGEDLKGKRVLIRCDLNVPLGSDQAITDDTRITSSMPTISYLSSRGARVIVCSHLGRPKSGPEERFSLKPVAKRMSELLGQHVKCAPDCVATGAVRAVVDAMDNGDVVVLENTRFHVGETANDLELAKSMASLADLYVNDAFGTAHRAHSSTEGVTRFLSPSVAGLLLKKELDYLKGAVDEPLRPMAAIVGGAKVSTKIPVIESMLDKVDTLIIGGGMVFTFLKARGLSVGDSLVEDDCLELARRVDAKAKAKGVQIILPRDVACGNAFPADGQDVGFRVVPADAIPDGWLGLDCGPLSMADAKAALAECKTIVWNGPLGVFESAQFAKGTLDVARYVAELTEKRGVISIVGGGDSVAAVNAAGLAAKMSHISTGGGASMELLEGKTLPGVAALTEV